MEGQFKADLWKINANNSLSPAEKKQRILALIEQLTPDGNCFVMIISTFIRDYDSLSSEVRSTLLSKELCSHFESVFSDNLVGKKILAQLVNEFGDKIFTHITREERSRITLIIGQFFLGNQGDWGDQGNQKNQLRLLSEFVTKEQYLPYWTALVSEEVGLKVFSRSSYPSPSFTAPEGNISFQVQLPAIARNNLVIDNLIFELHRLNAIQATRYKEGLAKLNQACEAKLGSLRDELGQLETQLASLKSTADRTLTAEKEVIMKEVLKLLTVFEQKGYSTIVKRLCEQWGLPREYDELKLSLSQNNERLDVDEISERMRSLWSKLVLHLFSGDTEDSSIQSVRELSTAIIDIIGILPGDLSYFIQLALSFGRVRYTINRAEAIINQQEILTVEKSRQIQQLEAGLTQQILDLHHQIYGSVELLQHMHGEYGSMFFDHYDPSRELAWRLRVTSDRI